MTVLLTTDLETRCMRCGDWHRVVQRYPNDPTAASQYAFLQCGPSWFFVGILGAPVAARTVRATKPT